MQKRPSIKAIFANWGRLSLILFVILLLLVISTISNDNSFTKSTNLLNQKRLVDFIADIGRKDLELASIQYRGKSTQLGHEHAKLLELHDLDILGQTLLDYGDDYTADLEILKQRSIEFTQAAGAWYAEDEHRLSQRYAAMMEARANILAHIDMMILKNVGYDFQKYSLQKWLIYAAVLLSLFIFGYYARRFKTIFADIHSLYSVEAKSESYAVVTEEVDVINKRMSRKSGTDDNPAFTDPITEINNYKGLLHAFANRKAKEGMAVCICVFDIDNFAELDKRYPKSFTQGVLKKIAFMLSLHEQHTDILARTDYSQFTMVFSRQRADHALRECEDIRQSIQETAFKVPKGPTINLTISGGFTQKHSNTSLEDTLQLAKEILTKAMAKEPNTIKQAKDFITA